MAAVSAPILSAVGSQPQTRASYRELMPRNISELLGLQQQPQHEQEQRSVTFSSRPSDLELVLSSGDAALKDALLDYVTSRYVYSVETLLHDYLSSLGVQIEEVEGHTGWYYSKLRLLSSVYVGAGTVCEVGFNAGHSALNALMAREDSRVLSFDLGEHEGDYLRHSYDFLSFAFPGRIRVALGDSLEAVPAFLRDNQEWEHACDVVLVDGGHGYDHARGDIGNLAKLEAPGTVLLLDDFEYGDVRRAWDDAHASSRYCDDYRTEINRDVGNGAIDRIVPNTYQNRRSGETAIGVYRGGAGRTEAAEQADEPTYARPKGDL
ncbi:hypothetical protein TrCOL_g12536 [Triparma columacea]|uniref:Uncharacterized protein n=1 Tax=Triparma columacea TaxID=722753 RepID=A0A9W7G3K2_9STRA|nr:hypothetical protein TrCOL_g12536 [Triparma columacea]